MSKCLALLLMLCFQMSLSPLRRMEIYWRIASRFIDPGINCPFGWKIRWSPDGKMLASVAGDGTVIIWNQ